MRALFLEAFLDITTSQSVGVARDCLGLVTHLIDSVVAEHRAELADGIQFRRAYEDFQEFVMRMVRDARLKGYHELHEDTFGAARSQCGLIWWCK